MGQLQGRQDDDGEDFGIELIGMEPLDGAQLEEVVFQLEDWGDDARNLLRERLEAVGVEHRWDDGELVVRPEDEQWVERLIDQVEDELSLEIDPSREQVAYDLSGWDDQARQALVDALGDEAVPHGWDGDELIVHELDEVRVDEIVESILDPGADVAPGEGGHEVMSTLFVAADKLRHHPDDADGALGLAEGLRAAETSAPPYGVDPKFWEQVRAQGDALAELLAEGSPDLGAVVTSADELRSTLRPYV